MSSDPSPPIPPPPAPVADGGDPLPGPAAVHPVAEGAALPEGAVGWFLTHAGAPAPDPVGRLPPPVPPARAAHKAPASVLQLERALAREMAADLEEERAEHLRTLAELLRVSLHRAELVAAARAVLAETGAF